MIKKQYFSIALFLTVILCLIAGCNQNAIEPKEPSAADHQTINIERERQITDMAGRTVTIPPEVKKGLGTEARASYMLYTMDPDTMTGINYEFNEREKAYILPQYHNLPVFGQGGSFNLEAVVAAAPEVLIIYGPLKDAAISDTEAIQQQTGIPCIMMGDALAQIPAAYRLLGEVFGREERCEILAQYSERALGFAAAINIPEEKRKTVYFGNGLDNLETAPKGSANAELLELVQAVNVAALEGEITSRIDISAEQVLGWNPEVILLNGEPTKNVSPADAVKNFLSDSRYRNVEAVKNGKVYAIPKYPYSWFDRPPGPNRLIGIYWLTSLLYPDEYTIDIKSEARDFYSLFYHIELSDNQLADLLGY